MRQGLRRIGGSVDGPLLGDVRGRGLMVAAEFAPGAAAHYGISGTISAAISRASFDRGMLLLPTGHRDTLRFVPPLVVSAAEVDECLAIVHDAVHEITARGEARAFG